MGSEGGLTVAIGAIVTIVTGFGVIAKIMLKQASKDREADRAERKDLTKAIKDMAGATGRVADATNKSASEAKDRNGHLAELVMRTQENNNLLAKNAVQEIKSVIETQTIKDQTVVHQHIREKDENGKSIKKEKE